MEWPFRQENSTIRLRILHRGGCLRSYGFSRKSIDFAWYMQSVSETVMISLHAFNHSACGASEIDIPIEDQTWSARFVERIRGSDRESLIGVIDFL